MARYQVTISEGVEDTFGLRSRCEEFLRNHAAPEKLNGENAAEDLHNRFREEMEKALEKNLKAIEITHEYPEGIELRFVGGPVGGSEFSSKTPGSEWICEAFRRTEDGKEGNILALDVTVDERNGPERAQYKIEHKQVVRNGDAVVLYCRFVKPR
jgi:hypothetical protein